MTSLAFMLVEGAALDHVDGEVAVVDVGVDQLVARGHDGALDLGVEEAEFSVGHGARAW